MGAWNTLPGMAVVEAEKTMAFKMLLQRHMDMRGIRDMDYVQADDIR